MKKFIENKILYPIKKFYLRITKILGYFSILWKDYDWDWIYILILLKYKIERTRKYIEKDGIHLHKETDIQDMKRVEFLLEKIIKDDFSEDLREAHDKKWGKRNMIFTKIEDSEYSEIHFIAENAKTEKEKSLEREEFREMYILSEKRREEAFDEVFLLLRNKIQHWWD